MKTRTTRIRQLCLVPALALALQAAPVQAEMIGAEKAMESAAQEETDSDRTKVQRFLERANVKERLQAMGVDALNAHERVKAMTDAEVHALAQRIDTMPAGGALSQTDWILILLVVLLLLVAL
jgi:hypothetical protein